MTIARFALMPDIVSLAGKFQRAFTLPVAIDPAKGEATFENGVLSLVLPKAESTKPRTIKVNATNTK